MVVEQLLRGSPGLGKGIRTISVKAEPILKRIKQLGFVTVEIGWAPSTTPCEQADLSELLGQCT